MGDSTQIRLFLLILLLKELYRENNKIKNRMEKQILMFFVGVIIINNVRHCIFILQKEL